MKPVPTCSSSRGSQLRYISRSQYLSTLADGKVRIPLKTAELRSPRIILAAGAYKKTNALEFCCGGYKVTLKTVVEPQTQQAGIGGAWRLAQWLNNFETTRYVANYPVSWLINRLRDTNHRTVCAELCSSYVSSRMTQTYGACFLPVFAVGLC